MIFRRNRSEALACLLFLTGSVCCCAAALLTLEALARELVSLEGNEIIQGTRRSTRHNNARLREMRGRTSRLREVLATDSLASEYLYRGMIGDGKDYEISVCRPLGVAFVHIYKAAGTTGKHLMELGCPEPRHHFSCCGCEDEYPAVFCHQLDEGNDWTINVTTTFTFARDPVERFRSGMFELARRQSPWLLGCIEKAKNLGRSLADVVIDDMHQKRRVEKDYLADPHVHEQTFFLSDRKRPPHALAYIAKVGPDLLEDMVALANKLFGLERRAVEGIGHFRDAHNASYGADYVHIHDQQLDPTTIAKIKDYYRIDYAWLGTAWPLRPTRLRE